MAEAEAAGGLHWAWVRGGASDARRAMVVQVEDRRRVCGLLIKRLSSCAGNEECVRASAESRPGRGLTALGASRFVCFRLRQSLSACVCIVAVARRWLRACLLPSFLFRVHWSECSPLQVPPVD